MYSVLYKSEVRSGLDEDEALDLMRDIGPGSVMRVHRSKDQKIVESIRYEDLGWYFS